LRAKPTGSQYRNLTARGGVIYYQRHVGGKRIRFSCKTNDWKEAAAVARLYEECKNIGKTPFAIVEVPRFDEFAKRYLEEDTSHLTATTRSDRDSYLREDGPLVGFFGARRLDEIGVPDLRAWWNQEVTSAKRSVRTGRCYLNVLSSVLGYACDLELIERSPVPAFRETLRRRSRTKQARADAVGGSNVKPIERAGEIAALLEAAEEEGRRPHMLVLLCLDAGLRLGEALGLRWSAIEWGDDGDANRALRIEENRPRGGAPTAPKSGRARRVALSRRLRWALLELYQEQGGVPSDHVLGDMDDGAFRKRPWRRILKRAEIGHRALKDLRDTFASQLLSARASSSDT